MASVVTLEIVSDMRAVSVYIYSASGKLTWLAEGVLVSITQ